MEQSAERRRIAIESIAGPAEDAADALARLPAADLLRLEAIARLRARALPGVITWSDLLNEAIRRVLDGSRPWPPDVPLVAFLAGVIRSVWSEYWRRNLQEAQRNVSAAATQVDERNPERIVAAAQALARVCELFAGDPDALKILTGLADGMSAREIRAYYGLAETDYDTIRRRMRRALLRRGLAGHEP